MRRLVLPQKWPTPRHLIVSDKSRHLLLIPLIAFITCLLLVATVSASSSTQSQSQSQSRAKVETQSLAQVMKEEKEERMLTKAATTTTFSNKTRTFPLKVSKNDHSRSPQGIAKGNYRSNYAVLANQLFI